MPKIGFACKLSHIDPRRGVISTPQFNFQSTTLAWLNRQHSDVAVDKLWALMKHNIPAAHQAVTTVGNMAPGLRMFRLGSDVLPLYTHPKWAWFWQQSDVQAYAAREFARVGQLARDKGVRLSFHPGQFCCIVSESDDVVTRSLEELEYHADMARWMGFGLTKLDFKINIHLSGRRGVNGFDAAWRRMSPELRNCLTLENDEYQAGLDDLLALKHRVGIVLDIHHHLIKEHVYIAHDDVRIDKIVESWCGQRPVIHYSQSRDDIIGGFGDRLPTMEEMLAISKKSNLRAHSDSYVNHHINRWALEHMRWADIMAECKFKNLASTELWAQNQKNP